MSDVPGVAAAILRDYDLALGDRVEVELLVVGQPTQVGPRIVEGDVVDATTSVLVVKLLTGGRPCRIPWRAIALIRDAIAPHPATT